MRRRDTPRNDNLFDQTKMTLGEHLEELRRCLVKALFGLVVALIIVFALDVPEWTIDFVQRPLTRALKRFYVDLSKTKIAQQLEELEVEVERNTVTYEELEDVIDRTE